ncbi:hypothetical protein E2C01_100117 [Portunus trituberculatus]|uniref:Uncharacterized protein n=1 Tax=Portunus trituberculatus TaxID=210409 RepID=A0A5B7K5W8_PORTR|nr:hypothetical protein [Portunus trituberculatus]
MHQHYRSQIRSSLKETRRTRGTKGVAMLLPRQDIQGSPPPSLTPRQAVQRHLIQRSLRHTSAVYFLTDKRK